MDRKSRLILLGLAASLLGAFVLAQGAPTTGGVNGFAISPLSVVTQQVDAGLIRVVNEEISGNLTFTQPRTQHIYADSADASVSYIQAKRFYVEGGGANGYWVNAAGSMATQAPILGTSSLQINSSALFNAGATNTITASTAGHLSADGPRGQYLRWGAADGGLSNLAAKFITVPPESFCDTTAGTGTAACNGAVSGIGRMGTGTYFYVYNTSTPAQALIEAEIGSVDATCDSTGAKVVDGGVGFAIYPAGPLTAACTTANTIVRWRIVDSPNF